MEHPLVTFWDSVLEGKCWINVERYKGVEFKKKKDVLFDNDNNDLDFILK